MNLSSLFFSLISFFVVFDDLEIIKNENLREIVKNLKNGMINIFKIIFVFLTNDFGSAVKIIKNNISSINNDINKNSDFDNKINELINKNCDTINQQINEKMWDIVLNKKYGKMINNNSSYKIIDCDTVILFFNFSFESKNNKYYKIPFNLPICIENDNIYSSPITYEVYNDTVCSLSSSSINSENILYITGKIEAHKSSIKFYCFPFELNIVYNVKGQMLYKLT